MRKISLNDSNDILEMGIRCMDGLLTLYRVNEVREDFLVTYTLVMQGNFGKVHTTGETTKFF